MLPADLTARLTEIAAVSNLVLATDFDGTLAPFVENPSDAAPIAGSMDLLREAATMPGVTVALVSGRDLDTLRRLADVTEDSGIVLIGSHGAQTSRTDLTRDVLMDEGGVERLRSLDAALVEVQNRHPDARIERKPASVALHTRGLPAEAANAALAEAALLAERPGVHGLAGKSVMELGVLEADKGTALRALRVAVDAQALVYLGDDVTDERAFARLPADEHNVTVKVGAGETGASYRVDSIPDVVQVFSTLLRARREA